MTHTFEFVAITNDDMTYHMHYKGKHSRMSKVKVKILEDLKRAYDVNPLHVKELYLKPIKKIV